MLGNHDYECGQPEEVAQILHGAGVTVLGEQAVVIKDVGFAGVKGFLGGFGRGELGAFGEAPIKAFVDAALDEARKLENALRSLKTERSVAVLHYSPVVDTVVGEPLEIYPFLGCSRLADAIDRFDHVAAVVHGHAHRGAYQRRDAARHAGLQLRADGGRGRAGPALRADRGLARERRAAAGAAPAAGRRAAAARCAARARRRSRSCRARGARRRSGAPCRSSRAAWSWPGMRSTSASATSTWPASSQLGRAAQPLGSARATACRARRTVIRLPSSALKRAPPALRRAARRSAAGRACCKPSCSSCSVTGSRAAAMIVPTACGWLAPKRCAQQRLEEAQRDAAVERAARGEGDEQALGAVGIADGGARLGVDLAEPLLERGDAAARSRDRSTIALGLAGSAGGGADWPIGAAARRGAGWRRAARGGGGRRDADHPRAGVPMRRADSPSRRARAGRRRPG